MRADVTVYTSMDLAAAVEENPARQMANVISVGGQSYIEGKKVIIDGLTDTKQAVVVAQTIMREMSGAGFKLSTIY